MPVTIKDVASRSGLSIATVSLVLNGRGEELKISAASMARVRAAAEELGYRSSYSARTLRSGRSWTLGVVQPSEPGSFLVNRFWSAVTVGIDRTARERGYNLLLLGARGDEDATACAAAAMDQRRVDALLVLGGTLPDELARRETPAVIIVGSAPKAVAQVGFDPEPGLRAAVEHLHGLGHRSLLWVGAERDGEPHDRERLAVIRAETKKRRMELSSWSVDIGPYHDAYERHVEVDRAGLSRLLPTPEGVTAALCWNDTMALALVSLLVERGIRVPERLSVVGFDDLHASHVVPPLTTIDHALPELGRQAVELAEARIDGAAPRRVEVPSRLVVRASTGKAPSA
jgi:DNA-binding LacI/PurR family transcriptional regulator